MCELPATSPIRVASTRDSARHGASHSDDAGGTHGADRGGECALRGQRHYPHDVRRCAYGIRSRWFEGVAAVAEFVEGAIFSAARRRGVTLRAGRCNGQPAFAVYQPGPDGSLVAAGLQILTITEQDGRPLVTDIVSYRSPDLAVRCGLPERIG